MKEIHGKLTGKGKKVAIIISRFNDMITGKLLSGAVDCLTRHELNTDDITAVWVPGAFELPQVAKKLSASGKYHGIIALGCVIRGATPHFDFVAGSSARGLASVALEGNTPVAFGVITTDTLEQALERAGVKSGNKGWDAALTTLEDDESVRANCMISKRKGRELALQCIYALEVGSDSYKLAEKSAAEGLSASIDDQKFGRMLVELVRHNRIVIEEKIEASLQNYDYERTALMDRLVMQLALAEVYYHPETPVKVVLSEYMQLSAKYSTAESPKFVNGLLSGIFHAEGLLKEEEKEES